MQAGRPQDVGDGERGIGLARLGPDAAGAGLVRAVIAAVAGIVAALAAVAPTGARAIDVVLVGAGVAAVTWIGVGGRRLAFAAVLVAGVVSWRWLGLGIAVVVATICHLVADRPAVKAVIDAVLIGTAMNLLVRSELPWFSGSSTLAALLVVVVVVGAGLARAGRRERRVAAVAGGAMVFVALVGTAAFGVTAMRSADDLRAGDDAADRGLAAIRAGDVDEAPARLRGGGDGVCQCRLPPA